MLFEVSTAKKQILDYLAEQDWSPTDLAEDLGKSPETLYNHLNELAEQGVLTKTSVAAKTRPKTEYSIGDGFVEYIAILPGQVIQRTLELDATKEALFRIWAVPQQEFHPYLEKLWWQLNQEDGLRAAAVYGSVARGEAGADSDIDLLLIVEDEAAEHAFMEAYGSLRLTVDNRSKLCMAQVYTVDEYRNSVAHGSEFLASVQEEVHVIHDPDRLLDQPEAMLNE